MTLHLPRIGYACINLDISPNSYRTLRKDSVTHERLREVIAHNLDVLERSIDYNIHHHNRMFRISSSLIPFGSLGVNTLDWAQEFEETFARIKDKIIHNDIRVSVHPGQYTVINSPNPEVVSNAVLDLEYHAKLLNLLAKNATSKMILHVGGIYDDKQASMRRFIDVYRTLSQNVRQYLVIENDDRLYTIEDVLAIAQQVPIPVVFDNLHHEVNPSLTEFTVSEILDQVVKTWHDGDGTPKVHYSQQDATKRLGAHSKTIDVNQFKFDYDQMFGKISVDIMLEVKDKNRSFIKVDTIFNPSQRVLEQEWARYKYTVMAQSQASYNNLRALFKGNQKIDPFKFYQLIDEASRQPFNLSYQINALNHVWGYFKKVATPREKKQYLDLIESVDESSLKKVYSTLKKLASKYQVEYLTQSYFFSD